jgi:hypothetical protein
MLPGHPEQVIQNGIHISRAGFVTNDPFELEADHFAAGLLMPETPFRKEMQRRDPSLDAIEALATICETSRTATAIRFAELSSDAVAVIVSTDGVIDYCFLSEAMKTLPQLGYLRKGTKLPAGTATASFAADAGRVHAGERIADVVDVRDWLGGTTKAEVSEETIGLGRYGKVLTVLASSSIGQNDEPDESADENEDEVVERWTPRFTYPPGNHWSTPCSKPKLRGKPRPVFQSIPAG